jgi:Matrixin
MISPSKRSTKTQTPKPFALLQGAKRAEVTKSYLHVYGNRCKCKTDARGYATPKNQNPLKLVLDASEGFIPLWEKETTLRWRFQESSLALFSDPDAVKTAVKNVLGGALLAWGDAVPVKFAERQDNWDFEIAIRESDDCDVNGCTLASAFFPSSGQGELVVYPKMFEQTMKEQIETIAHELGHVFGLRHFFAQVSEDAWPSQIFGKHRAFSIMNYGAKSTLTKNDKSDLKKLYSLAWSGQLKDVNKTKIKLVKPHHLV